MSSLSGTVAEATTLYRILTECDIVLEDINRRVGAPTTKDAGAKLEEARISAAELYFVARRLIADLKRFGLGEDIDTALIQIQKIITALRILQLSWQYFEAATTPWGWAKFAVTVTAGGLAAYELGRGYQR